MRFPLHLVLASLCLLDGCIYAHTVEPLTFNRHPTDMTVSPVPAKGDVNHIQFRLSVLWGTNGIGDVARKKGIETVYYADLEKVRVLFGIWQEDIVHVYGR